LWQNDKVFKMRCFGILVILCDVWCVSIDPRIKSIGNFMDRHWQKACAISVTTIVLKPYQNNDLIITTKDGSTDGRRWTQMFFKNRTK